MVTASPEAPAPTTYEWGSRHFAVPAQVVGEKVQEIIDREGVCPPERLVQEAASPISPLNRLFEWDDTEAASKYRRGQARGVISAIRVKVVVRGVETETPAFVSVGHTSSTIGRGAGYRPIRVVLRDADFRDEALQSARAQLQAIRKRYEGIEELADVWEAIDGLDPLT